MNKEILDILTRINNNLTKISSNMENLQFLQNLGYLSELEKLDKLDKLDYLDELSTISNELGRIEINTDGLTTRIDDVATAINNK